MPKSGIKNTYEVTPMFHGNKLIIKHKVGLLNQASKSGNICKAIDMSRDTFAQAKPQLANIGVEGQQVLCMSR